MSNYVFQTFLGLPFGDLNMLKSYKVSTVSFGDLFLTNQTDCAQQYWDAGS